MEIDEHLKYTLYVPHSLALYCCCDPLTPSFLLVYNLTLAPERENPWYRGVHPTISCDRFHRCPSRGYWAGGGGNMHTNKALAADLILYGLMPGRLLIPIMKIKDPCARSETIFGLLLFPPFVLVALYAEIEMNACQHS